MKTLLVSIVLLLSTTILKSQTESAWFSETAIISTSDTDEKEYKDNFVVKVHYPTKTITFKYGKDTQAFIYTGSSVEGNNITYFLEKGQMYYRVGITKDGKDSFIMFLPPQESKNPTLILNNVQILYTK